MQPAMNMKRLKFLALPSSRLTLEFVPSKATCYEPLFGDPGVSLAAKPCQWGWHLGIRAMTAEDVVSESGKVKPELTFDERDRHWKWWAQLTSASFF